MLVGNDAASELLRPLRYKTFGDVKEVSPTCSLEFGYKNLVVSVITLLLASRCFVSYDTKAAINHKKCLATLQL